MANVTEIKNLVAEYSTADGSIQKEAFTLPFAFVADVDNRLANRAATLAYDLFRTFEKVKRGYFDTLPIIAKIVADEPWKALQGCKGVNAFVEAFTGASKATCSELIKVAKCFYTSSGEIIEGWNLLTYSEMIAFSKYDEDTRIAALDKLKELGTKRTRAEVKQLLENEKNALLEEKNKKEYEETQAALNEEVEVEETTVETEEERKAKEAEHIEETVSEGFKDVTVAFEESGSINAVLSEELLSIAMNGKMAKTEMQEKLKDISTLLSYSGFGIEGLEELQENSVYMLELVNRIKKNLEEVHEQLK